MDDGNEIQAMLEQKGGNGPSDLGESNPDRDDSSYLTVKVVDQTRSEMFFKSKKDKPLKKMMDAYCQRQGIARDSARFVVQGARINNFDTPLSREMENEDIINLFVAQTGGNGEGGETEGQPKYEDPSKYINIKVIDENRHEETVKVKFTTKMEKVMNAFASSRGQDVAGLRCFTPDGKRILAAHTPADLELENDDVINVHIHQEGGAGNEEPQEEVPNDRIAITVKMGLGTEQTYKVKGFTQMSKLMNVYCERLGRASGSFRFFTPDGKRINPSDTPTTLKLEDGDLVDAHEEQNGGALNGFGPNAAKMIAVKVVNFTSQEVVYFKLKTTTTIDKLTRAYEERQGLSPQSVRYTVAGVPIKKHDTPFSLHLHDGSAIRAEHHGAFRINNSILFVVKDVLGGEIWFKTEPEQKFSAVMNFYCKRVQESEIRFETVCGRQIQPTDTMLSLDLVNDSRVNSSYVDLGQVTRMLFEFGGQDWPEGLSLT